MALDTRPKKNELAQPTTLNRITNFQTIWKVFTEMAGLKK
jgi:hypothetical protein